MQHKNIVYKRHRATPPWVSDVPAPAMGCPMTLSGAEYVRANVISSELDEIPPGASLEELISIIGPLTRDRGAVMRAIAAEELDEFADLAATAWRAREHGTESVLVDRQGHLHRQYSRWSARMEARAEKCRQILIEEVPQFDIHRYEEDPDYLKQLFSERDGEQFDGRVKAWKLNNRDHLSYLRININKLETENEALRSQLMRVREKHKKLQQSQLAHENQLMDENETIEKKCKDIKDRIGENAKKIDSLLLRLEKNGQGSVVRRLDEYNEPGTRPGPGTGLGPGPAEGPSNTENDSSGSSSSVQPPPIQD